MADYELSTFAERLLYALNLNHMKPANLAQKMGRPRGTIGNWMHSRFTPTAETTAEIARILGVNYKWLLGIEGYAPVESNTDSMERELLSIFRQLTMREQTELLTTAYAALDKHNQ